MGLSTPASGSKSLAVLSLSMAEDFSTPAALAPAARQGFSIPSPLSQSLIKQPQRRYQPHHSFKLCFKEGREQRASLHGSGPGWLLASHTHVENGCVQTMPTRKPAGPEAGGEPSLLPAHDSSPAEEASPLSRSRSHPSHGVTRCGSGIPYLFMSGRAVLPFPMLWLRLADDTVPRLE